MHRDSRWQSRKQLEIPFFPSLHCSSRRFIPCSFARPRIRTPFFAFAGAGGFGTVYKGTFRNWPISIKLTKLPKTPIVYADKALAARVQHPNLVKYHSCFLASSCSIILMELVDGPNMKNVLQMERELDESCVLVILAQTVSAISSLHYSGFMHRDIKVFSACTPRVE